MTPKMTKMTLFLGLFLAFSGFLSGCKAVNSLNPFAPGGSKSIATTGKSIVEHAKETSKLADSGAREHPEAPQWSPIMDHQVEIMKLGAGLSDQAKAIKASEAECAKWKEKADKASQAAKWWEDWAWSMMIVFGALGLVGSIILIKFDKTLAGLAALASIASCVVGLTMRALSGFFTTWGWAIGASVAALIVFAVGTFAYRIWRKMEQDTRDADEMAEIITDIRDDSKPETTIDTFIAAFRAKLPLLDKAMDRIYPQPRKDQ